MTTVLADLILAELEQRGDAATSPTAEQQVDGYRAWLDTGHNLTGLAVELGITDSADRPPAIGELVVQLDPDARRDHFGREQFLAYWHDPQSFPDCRSVTWRGQVFRLDVLEFLADARERFDEVRVITTEPSWLQLPAEATRPHTVSKPRRRRRPITTVHLPDHDAAQA